MTDKINNTNKDPVTEFTSLFTSNPEVVNQADYGDYTDFHPAPLSDLLSNNDEPKHKK